MMGEGLDASSIEELQQLENQLDRSLMKIRAKKYQLLREETEKLKEKERNLIAENKMLMEKVQININLRADLCSQFSFYYYEIICFFSKSVF
jgi:uncharacterized protein (DUF885 family)